MRRLSLALLITLGFCGRPVAAQVVGFVEIGGIPNGPAQVFLDDDPWPEPLTDRPLLLELAPGQYTLRIVAVGLEPQVQTVKVVEDDVVIVRVRLLRAFVEVRLIHLLPAQAEFAIEGEGILGETPATVQVPVGEQVLFVDKRQFCVRFAPHSPAYIRIRAGVLDELRGAEECELPPLPEGMVVDISAAPTFTRFTVAPSILNRTEVVRAMEAHYPPLLRDAGIGGTVRVYFFIDESGEVKDVRIDQTSGHQELDDAALAVAGVYRFSAALNRDEKVPVWVSFPITFQVR